MLESRYFLIGCVVLGFALRLAWMLHAHEKQYADWAWYYERAVGISEGDGYSIRGCPTAWWPPGWPALLALVFTIFEPSETLGKLVNIILYTGIIVLAYKLTVELFRLSRLAAGIVALMLAVYPNHIFYSSLLISETLYTFLTLLGVMLIAGARQKWWIGIFAGIFLGCAILTREQGYPVPLAAALALGWRDWKRGARLPVYKSLAVVHVAVLVTMAPWIARNCVAFHHFVPGSTIPVSIYTSATIRRPPADSV